jgi:hypothetical protein
MVASDAERSLIIGTKPSAVETFGDIDGTFSQVSAPDVNYCRERDPARDTGAGGASTFEEAVRVGDAEPYGKEGNA